MTPKIRKAVFPVAGLGTRFLPATKANPKEMMTVVDKPLLQYAAAEAVEAGIEVLIFVTGRNKRSIPDHFDKAYELETELERKGKLELLETVRNIVPEHVRCIYLRQSEALGLGHAVLMAKELINDEPFAVLLADDLIRNEGPGALAQMVNTFEYNRCSVLGVEEVPRSETHKYGIVSVSRQGQYVSDVDAIIEKPAPERAPSNLAAIGRYILSPNIFNKLENTPVGSGGEIQLTDAIAALLREERVLALTLAGKRYDCGDKLGYLKANVEYALSHPELGAAFAEYLRSGEWDHNPTARSTLPLKADRDWTEDLAGSSEPSPSTSR